MDYTYSALLAVGLFALTFLSPGPNLLVVVQASLASGRSAGIAVAVGVATGDALYASLGLFGMAAVIAKSGWAFSLIKIAGGAYLLWYALKLLRGREPLQFEVAQAQAPLSFLQYFRRGVITDLANPQTVLFFASIFSLTLTPNTPLWAKFLAWIGIVLASLVWRTSLSHIFSISSVRHAYTRAQPVLERCVGAALGLFGTKLMYEGIVRR